MTMQFNDQAGQFEDAGNEKCDHCGLGFKPDERMNFQGCTPGDMIRAAHDYLTTIRDQMDACECVLAKLVELHKEEGEKIKIDAIEPIKLVPNGASSYP